MLPPTVVHSSQRSDISSRDDLFKRANSISDTVCLAEELKASREGELYRRADAVPLADGAVFEVPMQTHFVDLVMQSAGQLNPWLSPALRGLSGKSLRDAMCQLTPDERTRMSLTPDPATGQARRLDLYCRGCELNGSCTYGRTFEPDLLIQHGRTAKGVRDGMRFVTLASSFPGPVRAEPGQRHKIRLLTIGESANSLAMSVLNTLAEQGDHRGLGPDRVKFILDPLSLVREERCLRSPELPRDVCGATVPEVEILLGAPLSIKGCDRIDGPQPKMKDFFDHSLRTVSRVIRECGNEPDRMSALGDVNFRGLKNAAAEVECESSQLHWFEQSRSSRRQRQDPNLSSHWEFRGWCGSATYRNVPLALIPWLTWSGFLGTGDSRVCGAGVWCLRLG